jgi:hypothetical protein
VHIDAIQVDLEVDSSRGVLCLSNELPALNVETDVCVWGADLCPLGARPGTDGLLSSFV